MLHLLRALTPTTQRGLGELSRLDGLCFDFFFLVFVVDDIAEECGSR